MKADVFHPRINVMAYELENAGDFGNAIPATIKPTVSGSRGNRG
jgi:hypothetical protein